MSKYLVLAAAMIVFAVACNKKEEAAPAAPANEPTIEQTAPADEATFVEDEAIPSEDAHEDHDAE